MATHKHCAHLSLVHQTTYSMVVLHTSWFLHITIEVTVYISDRPNNTSSLTKVFLTHKCPLTRFYCSWCCVSHCPAGPPAPHWRGATVPQQYVHCHWPSWGQSSQPEEQKETKQWLSHVMNMEQGNNGKCTLTVRYSLSEANDTSINLAC